MSAPTPPALPSDLDRLADACASAAGWPVEVTATDRDFLRDLRDRLRLGRLRLERKNAAAS